MVYDTLPPAAGHLKNHRFLSEEPTFNFFAEYYINIIMMTEVGQQPLRRSKRIMEQQAKETKFTPYRRPSTESDKGETALVPVTILRELKKGCMSLLKQTKTAQKPKLLQIKRSDSCTSSVFESDEEIPRSMEVGQNNFQIIAVNVLNKADQVGPSAEAPQVCRTDSSTPHCGLITTENPTRMTLPIHSANYSPISLPINSPISPPSNSSIPPSIPLPNVPPKPHEIPSTTPFPECNPEHNPHGLPPLSNCTSPAYNCRLEVEVLNPFFIKNGQLIRSGMFKLLFGSTQIQMRSKITFSNITDNYIFESTFSPRCSNFPYNPYNTNPNNQQTHVQQHFSQTTTKPRNPNLSEPYQMFMSGQGMTASNKMDEATDLTCKGGSSSLNPESRFSGYQHNPPRPHKPYPSRISSIENRDTAFSMNRQFYPPHGSNFQAQNLPKSQTPYPSGGASVGNRDNSFPMGGVFSFAHYEDLSTHVPEASFSGATASYDNEIPCTSSEALKQPNNRDPRLYSSRPNYSTIFQNCQKPTPPCANDDDVVDLPSNLEESFSHGNNMQSKETDQMEQPSFIRLVDVSNLQEKPNLVENKMKIMFKPQLQIVYEKHYDPNSSDIIIKYGDQIVENKDVDEFMDERIHILGIKQPLIIEEIEDIRID